MRTLFGSVLGFPERGNGKSEGSLFVPTSLGWGDAARNESRPRSTVVLRPAAWLY